MGHGTPNPSHRLRQNGIALSIVSFAVVALACAPAAGTSQADSSGTNDASAVDALTTSGSTQGDESQALAAAPANSGSSTSQNSGSESVTSIDPASSHSESGSSAAPVAAVITEGPAPVDPDYRETLSAAGLSAFFWQNTDFSKHTVPFKGIISGGPPPDGIKPIDAPMFTTFAAADEWLESLEPVIALEIDGDARAYPLQIMTWHEIVNHVIGGVPVTVTFCPLCNSAIAFDHRLDGIIYDFGTSGLLRNSDLVMYDRQTHS